ncbi:MAG: amidohydrolase family protein [Acidimicrobiales bacterium]
MVGTAQRTVLRGGKVFDGTGSTTASADIVLEDDRISDIGNGLDGDVEMDATGLTILPGFFDSHVHVTSSGVDLMAHLQRPFSYQFYQAAHHLSATLDCGITSIRDASGADLGVQQAVNDGLIEGPHMQISISALSQTGGHGDGWMPFGCVVPHSVAHPGRPGGIVDGPEEVRRKVRELIRAGADVIKVFTSGGVLSPRDDPRHAHFRDDELTTLVAEATAAGIFVMAHAQATDGIKSAIRAGIRSIEHGIFLDDEAIEMMIDRGTWLVPTLVAPKAVIDAADAGASIPETSVNKAREVMEIHRDSFSRAVRAGVKIAMGTDSGVGPHGNNLEELDLMHRGGLSTEQVYHATTSSAAALLGVNNDRGTIEIGKRADLVLLAGDLDDFANLKTNIRGVFKNGRRVRG